MLKLQGRSGKPTKIHALRSQKLIRPTLWYGFNKKDASQHKNDVQQDFVREKSAGYPAVKKNDA